MKNLKAILSEAGTDFGNVVKVEIFLADMKDYRKFNGIYEKYFKTGIRPARQAVGASSLPKNARVEISCIAYSG